MSSDTTSYKIILLPPSPSDNIFCTYNPMLESEDVKLVKKTYIENNMHFFPDMEHADVSDRKYKLCYTIGFLLLAGICVFVYMVWFRKN